MKFAFRLAVFLAVAACFGVACADVMYQCVDDSGHKTFSNVRISASGVRCTALDLGPAASPAGVPGAAPGKPAAKGPSPAGFPKVGENDQRARDGDRRRILESELATERQSLDEAKRALAEQEGARSGDERNYQKVLERLEPFKNKVGLHERNIEAIERELAKLR